MEVGRGQEGAMAQKLWEESASRRTVDLLG